MSSTQRHEMKRDSLASRVYGVWEKTRRLKRTHRETINALAEIWTSPVFMGLPQHMQQYLRGVSYGMELRHNENVEYSYEIDGRRMLIADPEYKTIPASVVHAQKGDSGQFVYRDDVSKSY